MTRDDRLYFEHKEEEKRLWVQLQYDKIEAKRVYPYEGQTKNYRTPVGDVVLLLWNDPKGAWVRNQNNEDYYIDYIHLQPAPDIDAMISGAADLAEYQQLLAEHSHTDVATQAEIDHERFAGEEIKDDPSPEPATKTQQDVIDLINNWSGDPCWDLEKTEGFEAHREVLLAVRLAQEKEWAQKENDRLINRSNELGCSVAMVKHLESQLGRLSNRIERLETLTEEHEAGGYAKYYHGRS